MAGPLKSVFIHLLVKVYTKAPIDAYGKCLLQYAPPPRYFTDDDKFAGVSLLIKCSLLDDRTEIEELLVLVLDEQTELCTKV